MFLDQLALLEEVDLSSTEVSGSIAGGRSLRKLNMAVASLVAFRGFRLART